MKKRSFMRLPLLALLCLLSLASVVAAPCNLTVALPSSLGFDDIFNGSLSASGPEGTILGATLLDPVEKFSFDSGNFSLLLGNASNVTRILFYAVTPDDCTATQLVIIETLFPPSIAASPPPGTLTLIEGKAAFFAANFSGIASWLLDDEYVGDDAVYRYRPDYNAAGLHNLTLLVRGENALTANVSWLLNVSNRNRPPIQYAPLPGRLIPLTGVITLNLSDYFMDPDQGVLCYTAETEAPKAGVAATVKITFDGALAAVEGFASGKVFVTYTATDSGGASVDGLSVEYQVGTEEVRTHLSYCGDGICFRDESCHSCAEDCGACDDESCTPKWECTDWGKCTPEGYQYRTCVVTNGCENITERPGEAQECEAEPSCDDGLMNGLEEGVDCGGPCDTCPTCTDGLLNHGEEGVDCGGPCAPCPSCTDGLLNQDETDVDCGGSCPPCFTGGACRAPLDCASKHCDEGVCLAPTCNDSLLNQDEVKLDCGGSCAPCPSCDDGLMNGLEEGVDCGGPCDTCPTCTDRIENQGEEYIDCGGPCAACTWRSYLPLLYHIVSIALFLFLLLACFYLARIILTSRMTFLFKHGKYIHFFYEDEVAYALVCAWNRLTRHFHRWKEAAAFIEKSSLALRMLPSSSEETLRKGLSETLRNLYANILYLSPAFEFETLINTVKRSDLPFTTKVILLRNTKILALLELSTIYTSASTALDEVLKALEELRRAF